MEVRFPFIFKPLTFTKKKKKIMKITIYLLKVIKLKNQVFLPNMPSINREEFDKI